MQSPTLHLIAGLPCSGKSTYSKQLAAETSAVVFCLDRWLISIFGKYRISEIGEAEHVRRVLACRERIWDASAEILKRGGDVILDDGFFWGRHRADYVVRARSVGAATKTHYLETARNIIRERLDRRNAALPEMNFHIESSLVDDFAKLFEAPDAAEGATIVLVRRAGTE